MTKSFIPVPQKSVIKSGISIPNFNLSNLNVLQLSNNIKSVLNNGSLTNNSFIFTSERYVKKIGLERERLSTISDIIEHAISINEKISRYQADVFLSQARIEYIINKFNIDVEIEAKKIVREQEYLDKQHTANLKKIDNVSAADSLILESAEIKNLKDRVEINLLESKNKQEKIKAELMQRAVENIDNLPPSLQVYLYRSVFNPQDKQDDDILLQDEIREYLKTEREAQSEFKKQEARKMKAQADQEGEKAEYERWKHERQKNRP